LIYDDVNHFTMSRHIDLAIAAADMIAFARRSRH
jgi:hypothetical protein